MPSYAKLEQAMLSPDQLALVANSRSPAIAALDQDALYDLIARLEEALKSAGPHGENGEITLADLFQAALRRAQADRRKRGLKPAKTDAQAAAKPASRQPPVRKRADRAAAKKRKDARTASRRVTPKGAAKTAAAATVATPTPAAAEPAEKPTVESAVEPAKTAPDDAPAPAKRPRKSAAEKARKAAKAAEEEAKAARKEAKKAVKRAEKATRIAAEKLAALSPGKKSKRKKKKG